MPSLLVKSFLQSFLGKIFFGKRGSLKSSQLFFQDKQTKCLYNPNRNKENEPQCRFRLLRTVVKVTGSNPVPLPAGDSADWIARHLKKIFTVINFLGWFNQSEKIILQGIFTFGKQNATVSSVKRAMPGKEKK